MFAIELVEIEAITCLICLYVHSNADINSRTGARTTLHDSIKLLAGILYLASVRIHSK